MKLDKSGIFGKSKTARVPMTEKSAWVRKQSSADATSLKHFFSKLSPLALYYRFMSPLTNVPPHIFELLCDLDPQRHVSFVVEGINDDGPAVIGEGRYVRDDGTETRAEFALSIAEGWRGQRLASTLITQLEQHAQANDIHTFWAEVLVENAPMLSLARKFGYDVTPDRNDPRCKIVSKHISVSARTKKAA
ncbi:GNAT family N-acetyltransferase [Roseovarius sp. EL26]|uniref:GNAT family N-acetyltransferase n=1 Tax=Roseovarius sp. EL26 TaxID=2126672 RepID=UPI0020B15226